MDERSVAWLSVGRAAVPDSVKQAVLSVFPDPIDALRADISAIGPSRQSMTPKQTLAGFVRHDELRRDIEWLSAPRRSVLGVSDPRFSRLLREIPNPPTVIYCEGELDLLDQPAVAVVGSRSPTPVGCESAMRFAGAMGDHQVTVVSGLALGLSLIHI